MRIGKDVEQHQPDVLNYSAALKKQRSPWLFRGIFYCGILLLFLATYRWGIVLILREATHNGVTHSVRLGAAEGKLAAFHIAETVSIRTSHPIVSWHIVPKEEWLDYSPLWVISTLEHQVLGFGCGSAKGIWTGSSSMDVTGCSVPIWIFILIEAATRRFFGRKRKSVVRRG